MKNPAARYGLAAALIVGVLILQFAGVFADDEGSQAQPAPTPQPTSTVTVDPVTPGEGDEGDDASTPTVTEDVVPGFEEQAAVGAAVARSTWSWQDRETLSWADRLAELSTDNYADQLAELSPTAVDEEEWDRGVVTPEATSRVAGVRIKHLDGSAESGTVDLVVTYDVEISYAKPELVDSHVHGQEDTVEEKHEAGEWAPLYEQEVNMRFVFEDGRWLLDAVAYPAS